MKDPSSEAIQLKLIAYTDGSYGLSALDATSDKEIIIHLHWQWLNDVRSFLETHVVDWVSLIDSEGDIRAFDETAISKIKNNYLPLVRVHWIVDGERRGRLMSLHSYSHRRPPNIQDQSALPDSLKFPVIPSGPFVFRFYAWLIVFPLLAMALLIKAALGFVAGIGPGLLLGIPGWHLIGAITAAFLWQGVGAVVLIRSRPTYDYSSPGYNRRHKYVVMLGIASGLGVSIWFFGTLTH